MIIFTKHVTYAKKYNCIIIVMPITDLDFCQCSIVVVRETLY